MRQPTDWWAIIAACVLVGSFLLALAAVLALIRWATGKLFPRTRPVAIRPKTEPPKPKPKPTPPWVWIVLIVAVGSITYLRGSSKPPRGAVPPGAVGGWLPLLLLIATGLVVVGFLGGLLVYIYRRYDRAASRAMKRGRAGDTAGAIAELRAVIEADRAQVREATARNPYAAPVALGRGAAARANAMGLLHAMRQEWAEAAPWFSEARRIDGRRADFAGNEGVALWKLGRPEEAEALLQEACSLAPESPLIPSNLGLVLADLGRLDEAREQLARAEANLKKFIAPSSAKRQVAAELATLRAKLARAPA